MELWLNKTSGYLTKYPTEHEEGDEVVLAKNGDLTALLIADFLDHEAEGWNFHDFVGVHRALAMMLNEIAGPSLSKRIFREILDKGGLWKIDES